MGLCDFAYFAAVMAPDADLERLRTICDWGNWIFPFDDIFDDGECSKDYAGAQAIIGRVLSVFNTDISSEKHWTDKTAPIVTFHDDIWVRIRDSGPPSTARLYARAMMDYCAGTLDQVQYAATLHNGYCLEQMLAMRRKSVCVAALFALVQFGQQILLPDFVQEHPVVKEIETIGIDLTLMHNDILSYDKEDAEGVPHNLVAVCRMQGMSAQEAVDRVAELIDRRHEKLEEAMNSIPTWDEATDLQLALYTEGIRDVVKANLYWSFRTARFLTQEQKDAIMTSGTIYLRE